MRLLAKKIRQAEMNKIPFMLIVGEKEYLNQSVSVRKHREGDLGNKTIENLIDLIKKEVDNSISSFKL
jgi:threonyl-tRNA synthetase